jgi:hypothetical protein
MSKSELLNETNFIENKNGRLSEAQMAMLTGNLSWRNWLLMFLILAIVLGAGVFFSVDQVYRMGALIASVVIVLVGTVFFYSPVYSYQILSEVRKNNIAYAVGKIDYRRNGYILQTDEVSLSLPFELQKGFAAGNTYEVFYLPSPKLLLAARLQKEVSLSQQGHELTNLLGKAFGFSEEELEANRNGDLSASQKVKILKGRGGGLAFGMGLWLIAIYFGYMVMRFEYDSVYNFGALILFVILLFLSIKFKLLKQIQEIIKPVIEKVDGVCSLRVERHSYTGPKGRERTSIDRFFVVSKMKFESGERQMTKLVEGVHLRVFYTRLGKRYVSIVSMEVVDMGEEAGKS